MNDKLWRDEDVAEYIGVSAYTARRKLFCKSNFPKAIVLPTGGPRGAHRRWVPEEVKKWVLRHRG